MVDKIDDVEEKVEDANGVELKTDDTIVAIEDVERGFTDGGRTPKIVLRKGELVTVSDVYWDKSALCGKVIIDGDDFDSYLFMKK